MSREELQAKFLTATSRTLRRDDQERLLAAIGSLAAGDLAPLLRLLGQPLAGAPADSPTAVVR
jgi:hypothetical protein